MDTPGATEPVQAPAAAPATAMPQAVEAEAGAVGVMINGVQVVTSKQERAEIMKAFIHAGPTKSRFENMTFEEVVEFLKRPDVISLCGGAIRSVLETLVETSPTLPVMRRPIAPRVYLACYMIVCKRSNVFANMEGELETALFNAGKPLIDAFELACENIANTAVPEGEIQEDQAYVPPDICALFDAYNEAFVAWKVPDERRLIENITHALERLIHARWLIPSVETEDNPLIREFEVQTARLEAKLVQIGGKKALDAFYARFAGDIFTSWPGEITDVDSLRLTYEIYIDPSYRLPDTFDRHPHARAQRWEQIDTELEREPPSFEAIVGAIADVRKVLREGTSLADADHSEGVADALGKRVPCVDLLRSIASSIASKEPEAREDAAWAPLLQELVDATGDSVAPALIRRCLCFFEERVRVMEVFAANARIARIGKDLSIWGGQIIRMKVKQLLFPQQPTPAGSIVVPGEEELVKVLPKTMRWLETIVESNASADLDTDARVSAYRKGMVALISKPAPADGYPELFVFDEERLNAFAAEINGIVRASVAHLFVKTGLQELFPAIADEGGVILQGISENEAADFNAELNANDVETAEAFVRAVEGRFPQVRNGLRGVFGSPAGLTQHIKRIYADDNPVARIVKRRILDSFESVFNGRSDVETPVHKIPNGAALFPRIEDAAKRFNRFAKNHMVVFGDKSAPLFRAIAKERATDAPMLAALAAMRPSWLPPSSSI